MGKGFIRPYVGQGSASAYKTLLSIPQNFVTFVSVGVRVGIEVEVACRGRNRRLNQKHCVPNRNIGQIEFTAFFFCFLFSITFPAVRINLPVLFLKFGPNQSRRQS